MDSSKAITQFAAAMRRRHLAPSTIKARTYEVRRWLSWCSSTSTHWLAPTTRDLERFLDQRELGARATYTAISHLSQWYRWLRRQELVDVDPTELLERPRLPRHLPRPARMDQITTAIEENAGEMRIMLTLMADAGLRCMEVAGLEWDDVDLDQGVMFVRGKGGHDRMLGMPDRLRRVLAESDELAGRVIGRELKPGTVSYLVNAELRRRGINATAHQLRHLYGTRMLEASGDITAVQQALGHASVTSTQIYARVDPRKAQSAARALIA
ncbi:MAG: tyrosine-type recombinase/integrase [Actinomycetota bacterium]